MSRIIIKVLKISAIAFSIIVLLLIVLPYLFPTAISNKIKELANNNLNGQLNFSETRLSFFNHFPALTLTLYKVELKGSYPYQKDTLVAAEEMAVGIDLGSVFSKQLNINQFFLTNALINIKVNEKGEANYNVYKSSQTTGSNDTGSTSLKIEKIVIENSHLVYNDQSLPMFINAQGFNYKGKGDLSKAIFDLQTHASVNSLDFTYNEEEYVHGKKLNADLITRINTNSLALEFQKNDLKINKLPVNFNGRFEFLKSGYFMDFRINSTATKLYDLFTALPPQYLGWLEKTDVKGTANVVASLTGKYIKETNTMPNLELDMNIRDGYLSYNKAPLPISNLFLNFKSRLPGLNPDSLNVNIDSLFFNIDKDYFGSSVHITGMNQPYIKARINSEMDLEKWDRALGLEPFDVKGKFALQFAADGQYTSSTIQNAKGKTDTVITSIPSFDMRSSIRNGYFKLSVLPEPITGISFNISASCEDGNYHHANMKLEHLEAKVLGNFMKGFINMAGAEAPYMDINFQTVFNLADIKKFYPLDSLDLAGNLNLDIQSKGNYNAIKKIFPVTKASIQLKDGALKTKYYPNTIEKIEVLANFISTGPSSKDIQVFLKPASLVFEGQPFSIKASLQNFDNLKYDITSNGKLDLARIYKVFSQKEYDIKGFIETDFSLKGLQSDALAGRYNRLQNEGTLKVKGIELSYNLFTKPLQVNTGLFRFSNDKMWFDQFKATYGNSDFSLDGYLNNVVNFILNDNDTLQGNFQLKSTAIVLDEFKSNSGNESDKSQETVSTSTGVIMVPKNVNLTFIAEAKSIEYNGINLKDFNGTATISNGTVKLIKTGFNLIDAPVSMDASYTSLSTKKAAFDYHLTTKDFDVKKAYNEILLFRDLATSAKDAEGIVSIDYQLSGKLDANMFPVLPSLKGNGVISVKKVKMNGFKLFSAVAKATDKDSINNPDLSNVNIRSSIANNIITIQRTKMRVAGFRPRLEGQVSLDGKLNLSFRLGLPPLGILGIPMTITGTQEKPIVAIRKEKETDQLEETEEE